MAAQKRDIHQRFITNEGELSEFYEQRLVPKLCQHKSKDIHRRLNIDCLPKFKTLSRVLTHHPIEKCKQ